MTYTIVICYPCPVTRQQRAQSSSIWSMVQSLFLVSCPWSPPGGVRVFSYLEFL